MCRLASMAADLPMNKGNTCTDLGLLGRRPGGMRAGISGCWGNCVACEMLGWVVGSGFGEWPCLHDDEALGGALLMSCMD